ncbi:MAG TPA: hypothetical protein PKC20_07190, partial [Burkholderiaceae bacterium]|nr:hypothetical protein [Burkholderiaceae bacterium]
MTGPARPARRGALRALARGTGAAAALGLSAPGAARAAEAGPTVHLYRSDATRAYVAAQGGDPTVFDAPWRALLQRIGLRATEVDAPGLAALRDPGV